MKYVLMMFGDATDAATVYMIFFLLAVTIDIFYLCIIKLMMLMTRMLLYMMMIQLYFCAPCSDFELYDDANLCVLTIDAYDDNVAVHVAAYDDDLLVL